MLVYCLVKLFPVFQVPEVKGQHFSLVWSFIGPPVCLQRLKEPNELAAKVKIIVTDDTFLLYL